MLIEALIVVHIAVLGYWLGAEFVINSTFRYVCFAESLPVAERDRLMNHVMNVDQHVRYALLLQWTLGLYLTFRLGYLPGGALGAHSVLALGLGWFTLVELTHRQRGRPLGSRLARIDRGIRYLMVSLFVVAGMGALSGLWGLQSWLAWKLLCFAGVILCGLLIRFALIKLFRWFAELREQGTTVSLERRLKSAYYGASSYLVVMWFLIAAITILSIWKP